MEKHVIPYGTEVQVGGLTYLLGEEVFAFHDPDSVGCCEPLSRFVPHDAPEAGAEQTACPGCPVCAGDAGVPVFNPDDIARAVSADVKPLFVRRPLAERLRQRLIDDAVDNGADPAKAAAVVADLLGERPLLDWLADGGWEKLLKLLLALLKLAV
jgi:hypothetical protein